MTTNIKKAEARASDSCGGSTEQPASGGLRATQRQVLAGLAAGAAAAFPGARRGSITSYFGVRRSGTTTLRRPRGVFPAIIQRSVFRNSHLVTAGSWAAGAAAGAVDAIRPVSRL